ncbi:adenosine receptor A1-like isoform X2 [Chironomus tepperi]|uniref:adenosine receptor A1-like isoform X2 n=1 Tax=Chironomus tepperi TaxID=113505 RepID=UPI00391EECE2
MWKVGNWTNYSDCGEVGSKDIFSNLTDVAIVAVLGNSLVILVFYRERRLRRRTNYYIISLATADFLVGLIGIPFAVLADIGLPRNLHACLLTLSALIVLCTISIFCLVAVSIDRYWAILHPLAYSRNARTKTAIGIITLCWVFGSLIGFLPLFGWYNKGTEQECYFTDKMDYNYLVFLYFTTIITPSIILAVFYGLIYRVILKQMNKTTSSSLRVVSTNNKNKRDFVSMSISDPNVQQDTQMLRLLSSAARKREVKATQNLSIIVLFFIICWIPLYTINCVNAFCSECMLNQTIIYSAIILSHFNSAVNPLLYAYHLKDFRGALSRLFHCPSQPETLYRPSLISQHQQRMSDHYFLSRRAFEPKIYVNSNILPAWKKEIENEKRKEVVNEICI